MSRSVKKGPYVQESLKKKIDALNAAGGKESRQDLEPQLYDSP